MLLGLTTYHSLLRKIFCISEDGENIYRKRGQSQENFQVEKEKEDLYGDDEPSLPTKELSKRADDFISKVTNDIKI